jgi:RNA polymerase sigma factor (sigma-70 family)
MLQNLCTNTKGNPCVETLPAAQVIEILIHAYGPLIFHTIYGMTRDWEESQDLTQDVFIQALKGIDAARETSGANFRAKAWLLRIALNVVRMQQRRRSLMRFIPFSRLREAQQEEDDTDLLGNAIAPVQPAGYGTPDAGDPAEVVAEREAIGRTLAQLPQTLRTPLLLSIVGGLSSTEIAALLDVGEAAVRQRLSRGRQQFRRLYTAESGDVLVNDAATTAAPGRERRMPAPAGRMPASMTA